MDRTPDPVEADPLTSARTMLSMYHYHKKAAADMYDKAVKAENDGVHLQTILLIRHYGHLNLTAAEAWRTVYLNFLEREGMSPNDLKNVEIIL